jgi:hypothetical protein
MYIYMCVCVLCMCVCILHHLHPYKVYVSHVWCELINKNRMRCSDLWWLFSKDLFPWHNFATKKTKSILKVWVDASKWTLHHITSHYHHIIGYHGITLSSWSHQGFGLQVASSLRRCPTNSNGEAWDGTRQPLDATWYGPTMPNGISQLPNVQNKVCAEAPAIYGSVMQCPHGYSDQ